MNRTRDEQIVDYYRELDRSLFIDDTQYKSFAHADQALPIGYSQTISQPSLVLEMTLNLDLHRESRVLEIGTGSGYQTALLARFSQEVYTVERIPQLSKAAQARLKELGFANIYFLIGDGSLGWPEHKPYDRIMVTAAARKVPDELVQQLRPGGRMIIPVGMPGDQELLLIAKEPGNAVKRRSLGLVSFVEFVGAYGWWDE